MSQFTVTTKKKNQVNVFFSLSPPLLFEQYCAALCWLYGVTTLPIQFPEEQLGREQHIRNSEFILINTLDTCTSTHTRTSTHTHTHHTHTHTHTHTHKQAQKFSHTHTSSLSHAHAQCCVPKRDVAVRDSQTGCVLRHSQQPTAASPL